MEFVNESKLTAGWTLGFLPDGRELLIVIVKGTFVIPREQGESQLADEQLELTKADEFVGTPGLSAPLYETDYAHQKPLCDLLVNGSAYASSDRSVSQIDVGVKVGGLLKTFSVMGNRTWRAGVGGVSVSTPEPFTFMPISYDNAFGGVDDNNGELRTFAANPVGRGYSPSKKGLDGQLLPNTHEIGRPIADPTAAYRPMALGPIGRNWQPRARLAGTYDQQWMEHRAPFWPDDFDYRYFQAAPADQQISFPSGGEEVLLKNLTPDGRISFRLPRFSIPVHFIPYRGRDEHIDSVIDTIVIEPDLGRFALTWRASLPLGRSCFDLKQVIAGEMPKSWHRARRFDGKPYYRNLAELVRARRGH